MHRVLFITQKIDQSDGVLGVYHEWAKRLAQKLPQLNIICLYQGVTNLPPNAKVYSLGKETGVSKSKYLKNFYKYIFQLRHDYDLVFVHMNPGYIWLGWIWWRWWGKKIVYWNANYKINWFMRGALTLADKGVTSIAEAFVASKKVVVVGQGIDTNLFKRDPGVTKQANALLSLGRISPVKNLETLLEAMEILADRGVHPTLSVVGSPTSTNQAYYLKIKEQAKKLAGLVKFETAVSHFDTVKFFNTHQIFVNLTASRSFDKSILEAMACETLIMVSNSVYRKILGPLADRLMFTEKDPVSLAKQLEKLISLSDEEAKSIGQHLRQIVVRDHNLDNLADKLIIVFNSI